MGEEKTRLNADISADIYKEFVEHVRVAGRSVSDVVREMVNKWNVKQRTLAERRARHAEALMSGTYGKNSGWSNDND